MPEHQRAPTSRPAKWLMPISWMAGLLSVALPAVIFFGSYTAAKTDERTCGLILLGVLLAGASLGSILSLAALILGTLSAHCSPQPLNIRRRLEIIILGLPLAAGLIFFAAMLLSWNLRCRLTQ